jgi:predicted adenylyl cyclase CyaB
MAVETEAKFEIDPGQLPEIRRKLVELGASHVAGPHAEENQLFDFPDGRLRRSGCALRLRAYGGESLLTFKGPIQPHPTLKRREEIETRLEDGRAFKEVLDRLGLAVVFEYEKTREVLDLEREGRVVHVCLDETPVGAFVEIEAEPEAIEWLSSVFGWRDPIKKSYIEIYGERRR